MDLITTHQHADFDGMASMIAAKKLYPRAVMAFSGSQEKNIRDFFVQSTEYLYDFQRIKNIDLSKVSRLIVVDTRQGARIGRIADCLSNKGLELHLYDHHPDAPGDLKGDYEVIRPVGSTATIFAQLFQEKVISISGDEATLLGMAIYEDTGSFTYDPTTPDDLAAMAWLLAQGANLQTISQFISQELSAEQIALLHDMISSASSYMMMENLNTLFALARMGNKIYFVARSRIPEVNVGKIAIEFGGGGHASAASAVVKKMTLIEAEEKLLLLLHKYVRPQSIARELMSAPVIYVRPELTIKEANDALTRYSLTVLPVLDEKQRILGIVSRRVTEKAIYHGLGALPVSDYMTTDFATLSPTATLADIQELIIEHRQRFIPVVENKAIKGVITRTDLLNLLVNDPANMPKNLLTGNNLPSIERQRNLRNLMIGALSRDIIVLLRTIGEIAAANKYNAYVVGGFVRDLLLHTPSLDIDIVIEGNGVDFAHKLAAHLGGKVRPHEKFSTAVVILKDGFKIDVATARLEYYEYPAAMPTVELSSIKLDLYRRDFTVNALAIHLNPDTFGSLVDFFNCQNDLKDRQIRILHNLSFVEDPTRILRAIRLEQRLGFTIGKHTEKLIKNAVKMNVFNRFYGRRFFIELMLILNEENPLAAIKRMAEFNLLQFFLPHRVLDQRLNNLLEECQRALAWQRLLYLDEKCRQWLVYLLTLFSTTTTKKVLEFCQKFEVPERYQQLLFKEKLAGAKIVRILNSRTTFSNSEIYWLLKELSHEGLLYLMVITKKQAGKKAVSLFVTHLQYIKPELQGDDLIRMGYSPGPLFKKILVHLLDARLDGLVQNNEEEEALVRKE
ncbi:MAG: CBS domain-containing protein, partial [Deltaproteobacteria bacterium]